MRPSQIPLHFAVLPLLVACSAVASAQWHVELDPAQTTIAFTLKATLHSVDGRLPVIPGSLVFDPATGAVNGTIVADARSAETGNTSRDEKMHTQVLRSAEHPRIVFTPRSFEGDLPSEGSAKLKLIGEMELVGVSHPVNLPVHVEILGDGFTADAQLDVPYVEWGLDNPSTFLLRVAKVVQVTIHAEGLMTGSTDSGH